MSHSNIPALSFSDNRANPYKGAPAHLLRLLADDASCWRDPGKFSDVLG